MAIKHRQLGLLSIFYVKMQAGGDYHVIFTLSTQVLRHERPQACAQRSLSSDRWLYCGRCGQCFFHSHPFDNGRPFRVASIIFQLTGRGEFLSFGLLYLLLNIPVMLIGWRMISITFIWRSLVGSIFYSAMVDLLAPVLQDWFSTYINRPLAAARRIH
jgi:hypothetical protein